MPLTKPKAKDHKAEIRRELKLTQAQKTFDEAIDQAEKAYQEAEAPFWNKYTKAVDQAQKVYREATREAKG
jgi:hypothetical protein